jgi:hypothetical protein
MARLSPHDAGSFSTTGGLVLALVSVIVGGAIYAIAYVARPVAVTASGGAALAGAGGGVFTGGEPISDQERLSAGDFSSILHAELAFLLPLDQCRSRLILAHGRDCRPPRESLARLSPWMEQRATVTGHYHSSRPAGRHSLPRSNVKRQGSRTLGSAHVPALLVFTCAVAAVALLFAALASGHMASHLPAHVFRQCRSLSRVLQ